MFALPINVLTLLIEKKFFCVLSMKQVQEHTRTHTHGTPKDESFMCHLHHTRCEIVKL